MSAHLVAGSYERSTGQKRTYTFTASYHFNGKEIIWGGTVRYLGQIKGSPAGTIPATEADDHQVLVVRAIRIAIENLSAVRE